MQTVHMPGGVRDLVWGGAAGSPVWSVSSGSRHSSYLYPLSIHELIFDCYIFPDLININDVPRLIIMMCLELLPPSMRGSHVESDYAETINQHSPLGPYIVSGTCFLYLAVLLLLLFKKVGNARLEESV